MAAMGNSPFFNPDAEVQLQNISADRHCLVIDEALSDPESLVAWACSETFQQPTEYTPTRARC
jgi:hypothetical protein